MKEFEENLRYLLLNRKGGVNRAKILNQLRTGPSNANQLAISLSLNYRTVQHHLDILMEHNLIRVVKKGGYGDMYHLDPELVNADDVFQTIILNAQRKVILEGLTRANDLDKSGMNNSAIGLIHIDKNMRVIFVNHGFNKVMGGHQIKKGEGAEKYFNSSLRDVLSRMDNENGTVTDYHTLLHRSDGSDLFVSITIDLIEGEEPYLNGYYLVIREEINPPREVDQTYNPTSKDHNDDILENVPVGIMIIEGDKGNIQYINRIAEEMFGKGMLDIPFNGRSEQFTIYGISGEPLQTKDLPTFRAMSKGEFVENVEMVSEKADGRWKHILSSSFPLKDSMGRRIGAIGSFSDITNISDLKSIQESMKVYQAELNFQNTELIRSQSELERSRNEYFDLFDSSPIGIFKLDPFGLITDVNKIACQLIGTIRSHLMNKPLVNIFSPSDRDRARQYIRDVVQRRKRGSIETGLIHPGEPDMEVFLTCRSVDPPRQDFACIAVIIERGGDLLKDEQSVVCDDDTIDLAKNHPIQHEFNMSPGN